MLSYIDGKQHRIAQFAHYLRLMRMRRQRVVDDCFIIFDEQDPKDADRPTIRESAAIKINCLAGGSSTGEGPVGDELPPEGWRGVDSPPRYIQLAFGRASFYLDLPKTTLFPNEAEIILQQRTGFSWARNRPDLRYVRSNWEDVVSWDPLQKVYLYRDEDSAAEDMAFVLFQVWKFPVDSPWYVKAASFHSGHQFEWGKPLGDAET